jgi:hypothetical protein
MREDSMGPHRLGWRVALRWLVRPLGWRQRQVLPPLRR